MHNTCSTASKHYHYSVLYGKKNAVYSTQDSHLHFATFTSPAILNHCISAHGAAYYVHAFCYATNRQAYLDKNTRTEKWSLVRPEFYEF